MTVTVRQVDSWQATVTQRCGQIQQAILDLIDCGRPDVLPAARQPTKAERLSQDRPDGRFHPTPPGGARRPLHESDPTLGAVEAWETSVEEAVTQLYGTVGEAAEIVHALGITTAKPAPAEPAVRTTITGRTVASIGPARARRATIDACAWLADAAVRLGDRRRTAKGAAAAHVADRAAYLERLTHALACGVDADVIPTCTHGCGREVTGRSVCDACRKRTSPSRRAS